MPEDIHILKIDQPLSPPGHSQPEADEASRRLYEEALPSIVKIEHSQGNGTGFAVRSSDLVVTAYHCVAGTNEIKVRTQDGKLYRARIIDIDDINDLATLKVEGNPSLKPLQLGHEQTLAPDDRLTALGHPRGLRPVYVSPGYFVGNLRYGDKLFKQDVGIEPAEALNDPLLTPAHRQDLIQILNRSLVYGRVHIEPGNSGGPVLDSAGRVVGVNDLTADLKNFSHSLFTPASDVEQLLNRPVPKFQFSYQYSGADWTNSYLHNLRESPLSTGGITAGAGGLGYYLLRTGRPLLGRVAPLALGIHGLDSIGEDAGNFTASTNRLDFLKYGTATLADTSMITGAGLRLLSKPVTAVQPMLAETTMAGINRGLGSTLVRAEGQLIKQALSRTGRIGVGLLAAGALAKVASEFIPNRLILTDTRQSDGEIRPPSDHWLVR